MADLIEQYLDAANNGQFLKAVYELSTGSDYSREQMSQALVELNNQHRFDLVGVFLGLNKDPESHRFFYLRSLLEPALPDLESPILEVMQCVLHLTNEAQGDMTSHSLVRPFIDFCASHSDRPHAALKLINGNQELIDLLSPTLIAGARLNLARYHARATELTKDSDIGIRQRAVHALGQMQYLGDMPLARLSIEALVCLTAEEIDDLLLGNAIKAAFNIKKQDKTLSDELTKAVATALERGSDYALHAAAEVAAFNIDDIPHELLSMMLQHLENVSPENAQTINMIDYAIKSLLRRNTPDEGIALLEKLLSANSGALEISTFGSVRIEIKQNQAGLLNRLATRWFSSGNYYLGRAITHLLQHDDGKPHLSVEASQIADYTDAMLLFLARKATGFLFFCPISAATFVQSLLSLTADRKTHGELRELLFDPLMINYPGTMTELLKVLSSNQSDESVGAACKSVLAEYDNYVDSIRAVGMIPEHRPPLSNQESYRLHFSEEMGEAMKKADEQSVFLSIVKKSVLLYGSKWITYTDLPDRPAHRNVSQLQSIETTMDIPRMSNIDPIGLDYMLRVFRNERLAK